MTDKIVNAQSKPAANAVPAKPKTTTTMTIELPANWDAKKVAAALSFYENTAKQAEARRKAQSFLANKYHVEYETLVEEYRTGVRK